MTQTFYEYVYGLRPGFPKDWTIVADVDVSAPYEVDQHRIYQKPDGTFAYAEATGCSCWEGNWSVEDYDSLELLAVALFSDKRSSTYGLTYRGVLDLLAQAWSATRAPS